MYKLFPIIILLTAALLTAQAAPDFQLKDIQSKPVRLSTVNQGKGVVMNFWATWCIPCRDEMSALTSLYDHYSEQSISFLAVSVDDQKSAAKVRPYVKSRQYPFTILLDTDNAVKRLYQVNVIPTTVLIDSNGKIVWFHTGYRKGDEKELEQEIQKLLAPESVP